VSSTGNDSPANKKPTSAEPVPDRSTADVGIVCTHKGELKAFLKRVDRQRSYTEKKITVRGGFLGETIRLAIAEAGEGYASHRAATELLINEHRPAWILAIGFSSSLTTDIKPGDIVLSNEISDTHVNSLPVKCTLAPRKRIHVGKLIVADHHPITPAEKSALAEKFPGLAVDTSSLAVAQVCQERNVRFMAIRGIVDTLEEEIPEQAASMIFHPTSRALGSAIGTMFKGLRKMSEMNSWRERANTVSANLDQFASGIIEQIAEAIERKR
jgi:nucleoside phosphorylase